MKAEVNWGPQSDMTFLCSLNHLNTYLKKSWAISAASTVLPQGARITPLLRPWLTTTMTESRLLTGGRSVMRLMERLWKGWEPLKARRVMAGTVGWVKILCAWQTAHPETYFQT